MDERDDTSQSDAARNPVRRSDMDWILGLKGIDSLGIGLNEGPDVLIDLMEFSDVWATKHGRLDPEKGLRKLLRHIRKSKFFSPSLTLVDLVGAALTYLRPNGAGFPPASMCRELAVLIDAGLAEDNVPASRVVDFILAYGAGWAREVRHGATGWMDVWPCSIVEITRYIAKHVERVQHWLNTYLGLEKRGLACDEAARHTQAAKLTGWFVQAEVPYHLQKRTRMYESGIEVDEGSILVWALGEKPLERRAGTRIIFETTGPSRIRLSGKGRVRARYFAQHGGALHSFDSPCVIRVFVQDNQVAFWVFDAESGNARLKVQLQPEDRVRFALTRHELLFRLTCGCGHRECDCKHRVDGWDPVQYSLQQYIAKAVAGGARGLRCKSIVAGMLHQLMTVEGFYEA